MHKLSFLFVIPFFFQFQAEANFKSIPADSLTKVHIKNGEGSTNVSGTSANTIEILADMKKSDEDCLVRSKTSNGVLTIWVEDNGWWFFNSCRADLSLKVPKKINLEVNSGSESVIIDGLESHVILAGGSGTIKVSGDMKKFIGKMGSGTMKISGNIGQTDVSYGSGAVKMTGFSEQVKFQYGSGSLDIKYNKTPQKGSISVSAGSGAAQIALPEATRLKTDFKTGSGSLRNSFAETPASDFKIYGRTGSGSIEIKKM